MAKKRAASGKSRRRKAEEPDFESALSEVEEIVAALESGELGLSESLDRYEQGIKSLKRCHALLEAAEQRVSLLAGFDADGNPITEPFDETTVRTGSGRKRAASAESPDEEGLF